MSEVTFDGLKKQLQDALASGDVDAITKASQAVADFQRAQARVAAEKAREETNRLSGERQALAEELTKSIKASKLGKANFSITLEQIGIAQELVKLAPDIVKQVEAVKGTTVIFKLPDEQSDKARVALAVVPTKRASGGGVGRTGKTSEEYGMSLNEVYEKFATPEDKAKMASATSNSSQWQIKVAVKKQAIANGQLAPVK